MPNPNYMENQKELAWKMRGILMDWLIQVHSRFKLLPETLFMCVNLIDRFLSARVVSLAKLQLVGVTCMFIAAKVEETVAPSVTNFVYCSDSSYTEQEILQAEKYILKTLDWNLSYPCPLHFLRRISKADDYNVQVRTVGKYLVEVEFDKTEELADLRRDGGELVIRQNELLQARKEADLIRQRDELVTGQVEFFEASGLAKLGR